MLRNMKHAILSLLLLLPAMAHAVICKTVQPDGTVSYADVPAAECEQPVDLPDYSRYAPRPIQEQQWTRNSPGGGSLVRTERYTSMAIVQPEPGGTVRSNQGNVSVTIALQPALQQNHKVMLYLDGAPVGNGFGGTTIEINGVRRGSHSLRAAVVDPSGQRLIEAPAVRFFMRQTSLLEQGEGPKGPTDLEQKAGDSPVYNPTPDGSGSYQPKPGGIPSTPGTNNPAFKPSFNP
jgi:hypothetical protein